MSILAFCGFTKSIYTPHTLQGAKTLICRSHMPSVHPHFHTHMQITQCQVSTPHFHKTNVKAAESPPLVVNALWLVDALSYPLTTLALGGGGQNFVRGRQASYSYEGYLRGLKKPVGLCCHRTSPRHRGSKEGAAGFALVISGRQARHSCHRRQGGLLGAAAFAYYMQTAAQPPCCCCSNSCLPHPSGSYKLRRPSCGRSQCREHRNKLSKRETTRSRGWPNTARTLKCGSAATLSDEPTRGRLPSRFANAPSIQEHWKT